MDVVHEDLIAVLRRPITSEIDHRSRMRVPATYCIGFPVSSMGRCTDIVSMLGNGFDIVKGVRVKVISSLPFIAPTLNHMIQVWDYAGGNEGLSAIVKIDTPWVASSMSKDLEFMLYRMISPYSCIDWFSLSVRGTWLANSRMRKNTMTPIQPTVRSPNECVQRFMCILISPTIQ